MKLKFKRKPVTLNERKKTIGDHLSFEAKEAYKRLRTNIRFALPLKDDKQCRVIGVTSALPSEGKSTTSVNLAFSLAEAGERVLLIEADMRLPNISLFLDVDCVPGLSDHLISGDETLSYVKVVKEHENFHVIPAGNLPPNPSELLGLPRMRELLERRAQEYTYIIVDLPPINVVTDAAIISEWIDGVLMVVRQNHERKRSLNESLRLLKYANAHIIGFVFNCVGGQKASYHKYGEYSGYT